MTSEELFQDDLSSNTDIFNNLSEDELTTSFTNDELREVESEVVETEELKNEEQEEHNESLKEDVDEPLQEDISESLKEELNENYVNGDEQSIEQGSDVNEEHNEHVSEHSVIEEHNEPSNEHSIIEEHIEHVSESSNEHSVAEEHSQLLDEVQDELVKEQEFEILNTSVEPLTNLEEPLHEEHSIVNDNSNANDNNGNNDVEINVDCCELSNIDCSDNDSVFVDDISLSDTICDKVPCKHAIVIASDHNNKNLGPLLEQLNKFNSDIYIFEQNNNNLINLSDLFNSIHNMEKEYEYYIFHDANLLCQDNNINYIVDYEIPKYFCNKNMCGVLGISKRDFLKIGGFNNHYEGRSFEFQDVLRKIEKYVGKYEIENVNFNSYSEHKNLYNDYKYYKRHVKRSKIVCVPSALHLSEHCQNNVHHYLCEVDMKHFIPIIVKDNLMKVEIQLSLLQAIKDMQNVIITTSDYTITQECMNYYQTLNHSYSINNDTVFLHYNDIETYLYNGHDSVQFRKLMRTNDKIDNDYVSSPEPLKAKDNNFNNVLLYKFFNPDLNILNYYNIRRHYNLHSYFDNRVSRVPNDIVPETFDLLIYYENYSDIAHACKNLFEVYHHFINHGRFENRKYDQLLINDQYSLTNIDWSNRQMKSSFLNDREHFISNASLLTYTFPEPKVVIHHDHHTLVVTDNESEYFVNTFVMKDSKYLVLKMNENNVLLTLPNNIEHTFLLTNLNNLYLMLSQYNITNVVLTNPNVFPSQVLLMVKLFMKDKNTLYLQNKTLFKNTFTYNKILKSLIDKCEIIAPLNSIKNYYKQLNVTVLPYDEVKVNENGSNIRGSNRVILVLNDRGNHELKRYLDTKGSIPVMLYGKSSFKHKKLTYCGKYNDLSIINVIKAMDPKFIWFPYKGEDQYSFSLSRAIESNYQIVASLSPVFKERLENCKNVYFTNDKLESVINHLT